MNYNLPKDLRRKQQDAKKSLAGARRILDYMEKCLKSNGEAHIEVASAFFQAFKHHLEEGDLKPENLNLATLLRRMNKDC